MLLQMLPFGIDKDTIKKWNLMERDEKRERQLHLFDGVWGMGRHGVLPSVGA